MNVCEILIKSHSCTSVSLHLPLSMFYRNFYRCTSRICDVKVSPKFSDAYVGFPALLFLAVKQLLFEHNLSLRSIKPYNLLSRSRIAIYIYVSLQISWGGNR